MDRPLDFNQQMAETSDRSDHEEGRATGATERTATRSDPKSKRKTDVAPSSDEDSTLIDDRTALSTSPTHFFRFVSFRFVFLSSADSPSMLSRSMALSFPSPLLSIRRQWPRSMRADGRSNSNRSGKARRSRTANSLVEVGRQRSIPTGESPRRSSSSFDREEISPPFSSRLAAMEIVLLDVTPLVAGGCHWLHSCPVLLSPRPPLPADERSAPSQPNDDLCLCSRQKQHKSIFDVPSDSSATSGRRCSLTSNAQRRSNCKASAKANVEWPRHSTASFAPKRNLRFGVRPM